MIEVVWGTGLYASEFMYTMRNKNIEFFIDNDSKKRGKFFCGKKILSPDEVKNWDELYIYIPFNFYDEIVAQLKSYGFEDETRFQKYYEINKLDSKEFQKDHETALNELHQQAKQMEGGCIFWGRSWAFEDKGYREYIQAWRQKDKNLKLGLVSEAIWYSRQETEQIMNLPTVVTSGLFDANIYIENGVLDECQMAFLKKKKYAFLGAECLRKQFLELTEESANYMVYYMYQYVIHALDALSPRMIIVYPLLAVRHLILEEICLEKGIPLISTHQGILPGTLSFDIGGEMGKSLPAMYPEEFLKLPVSEEDIEHAQNVWDYLYQTKLNRKIQHKTNCIEYIMQRIDRNRPIVFYAGQNDVNSNMVPYTEETRKYHSPIFETSIDAGIYIAELCRKNNWNFIYKPHPMRTLSDEEIGQLPDHAIYIEHGDINDLIDISDVVITILSQTNYVSLIRHKPVVMLGYNQAKGKGFTYEAFAEEKIEEKIMEALKNGFSKEQEEAFLKHIAQVLKYYLFDDLKEREIRFGRSTPCHEEEFYELERLLKESDGKK